MEEIPEIRLHIDRNIFTVKKDLLCEHSDYFRAMFSGNYVEKKQHDITIDVDAVDANSMIIILQYMKIGLIDLSEYQLPVIGSLAVAANFLQCTELTKQIEYCLDLQISPSTWIETMNIAEKVAYTKLEQTSAAFGLLSFKKMLVEYIPTVEKLFWYLSHPYLDTDNELDVYNFGMQWMLHNELEVDALLILLSCLDIKKLTVKDLKVIRNDLMMRGFVNSFVEKIVECLIEVCEDAHDIFEEQVVSMKEYLCQMFTVRVYNEVINLVRESKVRKLTYTPLVPVWMLKDSKLDFVPHFMYTFSEDKGFEKWLEVGDKNLWGWTVVSWGAHRLVIVGGEYGRGTGGFMRDVKVYDTLRKEWVCHGVHLPPRRHGGATIIGDTLFLIGGVGGFRVVLDTAITYDLKHRSFRKIAKLPDAIQSPAICTHKGEVYASGHKSIYKYEEQIGDIDYWSTTICTEMRTNRMTSFKDYIYCAQNYFSPMYRFKPGVDDRLELITNCSYPAAAICNFNNRLLVFTKPPCGQSESDCISVEEFKGVPDEKPKVLWTLSMSQFTVNDVAGCCTLVINIPPIENDISQYHQKNLTRYC